MRYALRPVRRTPKPPRPVAVLTFFGTVFLAACIGRHWETFPPLPEDHPRLFFFALDAIPHGLVEELTDPARGEDALFQGFTRPVPLISSFPATSSLAFSGILEPFDLPKSPGYEAKFFDRSENSIRGGGLFSYSKIPFGWREFFTWNYNDPVKRALASARPVKGAVREVEWVLARFAQSDKDVFHGYSALTDAVAHLEGPEGLIPALTAVDRGLRDLRRDNPGRSFHAVIYSDHGIAGGQPLANVRADVQAALEQSGFRVTDRLRRRDDAVMVPFGLVSSFEIYVRRGRGADAARIAGRVEGVEVCVAREPGTQAEWRVAGAGGEAVIARRYGSDLWTYRVETGDPLGYSPLLEELSRRSGNPDREWFPDAEWFEVSHDHRLPDALYRLSRTFNLVRNTASAACSVEPGHMYGSGLTEMLARVSGGRLEWTHGALTAASSNGFLLTDVPGWQPPEALRFDRALADFAQGGDAALAR